MANSRKLWADKIAGGAVGKSGVGLCNALLKDRKSSSKGGGKKISEHFNVDPIGGFAPPVQFSGVILGIDPSLRGTGLAVVEVMQGARPRYIDSITVKNAPQLSIAQCLKNIYLQVDRFVWAYGVKIVSIEQSIYVQNNRVALLLGSARGAAIAAAAMGGAEIFEYAPLRIKQAVVGFGRASKEQVSRTMSSLVDGAPKPFPYDEADAAAAALAHAFTKGRRGVPV